MNADPRPHVMHLVHRFDTGGLENGIVNLINHMPEAAYRHTVVALTEVTAFRRRITRDDVGFVSLNKAPGQGVWTYPRIWRLLRELRPQVLHTRNLGPLEMQLPAALAGVRARVHGEHGRELNDLDGSNRRLQRVRRLYKPFIHRYVALSQDLERYLRNRIGIAPERIRQIYNGVDTRRFHPAADGPRPVADDPFAGTDCWRIGSVGRMQGVKNPLLLAQAFVRALALQPSMRERARLVMTGDGPERARVVALLQEAGVAELAWLPGERADVADILRSLDAFVLPSLAEGISNTILEAMASGLPVLATAVGGNAELVADGRTGAIVPSADADAMAHVLVQWYEQPESAVALGRAGRAQAERRFSLGAMVGAYQTLYDEQLATAGQPRLEH